MESNNNCSGSFAAHQAGEGDAAQCPDCAEWFPVGDMFIYPAGKLVCESCHKERELSGQTKADFGVSEREDSQ